MAWTRLWRNTMENGLADGTDLTVTNSDDGGAGDALSRLIIPGDVGTGNSLKVTTAWKLLGTRAWRFIQGAANRCQAYINFGATYSDFSFTVGVHYGSTPGANGPILRLYADTTYTTVTIDLQLTTANKILIRDAIAATSSSSSTGVLTPGNDYEAVFRYDAVANTATWSFYLVTAGIGSPTAAATVTYTIAADTVIGSMAMGIINSSATGLTLDLDQLDIGQGGLAPRSTAANAAPTVALVNTATRYVPAGSTISDLAFTANDSDGTVSSFSAAVITKPAGASTPTLTGSPTGLGTANAALTLSATFGSVGTYEVAATAVDNVGDSNVTTTKYVIKTYPAVNSNTIIEEVTPGEFVQYGSTSDPKVALADSDSATGLESPPSPVGKVVWVKSGPVGPTGISIRVSGSRNGSGTLTCLVELFKADKTTSTGWSDTITFTGSDSAQTLAVGSTALAALSNTDRGAGVWWKLTYTLS